MKPREFPCNICPNDYIIVEPSDNVAGCVYIGVRGDNDVQLTVTNAVNLAEELLKSARKVLQDG